MDTMKDYSEPLKVLKELPASRIVLKPVQVDWVEPLFEAVYESRVELRRYMAWETDELEEIRKFLEKSVQAQKMGEALSLCIFEKSTGDIAGNIGLKTIDQFTPRSEIGYWIRSTKAGHGYATEALLTLIKYCRGNLELVRLDAQIATTNIASQRVVSKCGFEKEGFKAKSQLCHGIWQDFNLYGKLLGEPSVDT